MKKKGLINPVYREDCIAENRKEVAEGKVG